MVDHVHRGRALLRKPNRRRAADPASAASDQHDLVVMSSLRQLSPLGQEKRFFEAWQLPMPLSSQI
jgi:hypothetical protein